MLGLRRKPRSAVALGLLPMLALLLSTGVYCAVAGDAPLIEPRATIVDRSLPSATIAAQTLAALRYDTFWNTGGEALARAALAPDFTDRTLPPGRAQGIAGPLGASKTMRAAIPDLRCDVERMIVAGDRVVAHLRVRGHFTGRFNGSKGHGQAIDFVATDISRVVDGRIAENWHIEDNLALLQQLGVVSLKGG